MITPKTVAYLKSAIRKIWRWSAARRECLKAKVCVGCRAASKKLFADHIKPVVDPERGFTTWDEYIDRMFNGALQPLCKKCHAAKTARERKERAATRKC